MKSPLRRKSSSKVEREEWLRMAQVRASVIVNADRRELFLFTDWCYNLPEWFPAIRKARIVKLPNSDGLGKITHYNGTIMGREMEWEAHSIKYEEDEPFMMKASNGTPAKFNMQLEVRFESLGIRRTKATGIFGFHAPYPLIGPLIDRFYVRKEAQRLINSAIDGIKNAVDQNKIPSVNLQFENRKADHPGYSISQISAHYGTKALARN